ncbi:MAG: 23S rRNA (adenine(2503)-C(2))-methyltransferase RlmN [Nitrospirae bacterium]|nr:23S rRNA (adenine(2503)-C(2))-methyltransferase RlmN [Nitrospirota bacterium]
MSTLGERGSCAPTPCGSISCRDVENLLDLTLDDLTRELNRAQEAPYRARQIFHWTYVQRVPRFDAMANLPTSLRESLSSRFEILRPEVRAYVRSADGTQKWALGLADGLAIETVLIPDGTRRTLCLSSQVGCAFGCVFCSTATMKWRRNLSPGEIVAQLLTVLEGPGRDAAAGLNLVFMGMGEPTANLEAVGRAIRILTDRSGLGFSPRRITVSTVGVPAGIAALARWGVGLAISLNAVRDDLRTRLMPVNKTHSLADVLVAAKRFGESSKGRLTFEYVLLGGLNDGEDEARLLAGMGRDANARVNVIPFNPPAGGAEPLAPGLRRPTDVEVDRFAAVLAREGATVMVRRSRGADIGAACGQLAVRLPEPATRGAAA